MNRSRMQRIGPHTVRLRDVLIRNVKPLKRCRTSDQGIMDEFSAWAIDEGLLDVFIRKEQHHYKKRKKGGFL